MTSRQVMNITQESDITFGAQDLKEKIGDDNDLMVIKMDIANFTVHKVLVDNESSADIILKEVLTKMGVDNVRLNPVHSPLVGFGGSEVDSLGTIELPVSIGDEPRRKTLMAIVSTYHLRMKFPTLVGVGEVACDQVEARRCYNLSVKKEATERKRKFGESPISENEDRIEPIDEHREIELVQGDPSKTRKIGSRLEK
ncbi:uncharacterized protein LOC105171228 [Sesamum indicum]|uniref:Uncharacterized protein LOC105171228 n=1 Tax=Sesamum indicum TaxID=4182 RepID=A0A6I9TWM8_SESIN|nr:uncharacterized protein LOC105171228 [Sesamum indicum]